MMTVIAVDAGTISLDGSLNIQTSVYSDVPDAHLEFVLQVPNRAYAIKAESMADKNEWVGAIRKLCEVCHQWLLCGLDSAVD